MTNGTLVNGCSSDAVYGLRGAMHGGAKTLILMSAAGASALSQRLRAQAFDGVAVQCAPGALPLLQEKRRGALAAVIDRLAVHVLTKADWDRQKILLSDSIYR